MVAINKSTHYRITAQALRQFAVGALALSGLLMVSPPALADAFLPPPELSEANQAMLERLQRLEGRLQKVDQLERRIEQQAVSGPVEEDGRENSDDEPKEELTIEQRIALRNYLSSQFEHVGQVNGTHIVKVNCKTEMLKGAEYNEFLAEQQAIAERRVVSVEFDALVQQLEQDNEEGGEKGDEKAKKDKGEGSEQALTDKQKREEELASARERLEARRTAARQAQEEQRNRSSARTDDYRASSSSSSDYSDFDASF